MFQVPHSLLVTVPGGVELKLSDFVNREEQLSIFEQSVLQVDADETKVINLFGIGGQGKSFLLKKYRSALAEDSTYSSTATSYIDLTVQTDRQPHWPMIWLRNDLAKQGMKFPAFDIAFELYWSLNFGARPTPYLEGRWLRRSADMAEQGLSEFGTYSAELTVAAITEATVTSVPVLGKLVSVLGRAFYDRSMRNYILKSRSVLEEFIDEIDNCEQVIPSSQDRLINLLPKILASDVQQGFKTNELSRLVVFVDEFERAVGDGGFSYRIGENPFLDGLTRLVQHLKSSVFIVSGRERSDIFNDVSSQQNVSVIDVELGGIPNDAARKLLTQSGVVETDVVESILTSTKEGSDQRYYALLLSLQIVRFHNLMKSDGTLKAESFEILESHVGDRSSVLIKRLLRDYDAPTQATLKRLAACRKFDREVFRHTVSSFATGLPADSWRDFKGLSFVLERAGQYKFHDILKDIFFSLLDKTEQLETHQVLADYYTLKTTKLSPKDVDSIALSHIESALFHILEGSFSGYENWLRQTFRLMKQSGYHEDLLVFSSRVCAALERREHTDSEAYALGLSWWAMSASKSVSAGDIVRRLTPMMNQYRQRIDSVSLELNVRYASAIRAAGETSASIDLLEDTLVKCKKYLSDDDVVTVICMNHLGLAFWYDGSPKADAVFRETFERSIRSLGADNPESLVSGHIFANRELDLNRFQEAETIYWALFKAVQRTFGSEHREAQNIIEGLRRSLKKQSKYSELLLFEKDIYERSRKRLGRTHETTIDRALNLIVAHRKLGMLVEAESLSRDTFERCLDVHGPTSEKTKLSARLLAYDLRRIGRDIEAEQFYRSFGRPVGSV